MAKHTIDADASGAVRAAADLERAYKKVDDGVVSTVKGLTKAEKQAKRFAEQSDPTKRYERQMLQLAEAVKKGGLEFDDAQRNAERFGRQLDKANRSGERSFDGMVLKLGKITAGLLSATEIASQVRRELEAQQVLIDKRVATQVTVDQSRAGVRRNLAGESDATISRVQSAAVSIADQVGISETYVNQGLETAISASGGQIETSIQATRLAAQFNADTPANIGRTAGTLLDLAKVTGTNDPRINLGYLSFIGAAGRVVDVQNQTTNIAPGVIGTLAFGGNARDSGALFAALTNAGADTTGARTGTSLINLSRRLQVFDRQNDAFDGLTVGDRIRALQNSSGLRREFLEKNTFDSGSDGLIRELLSDPESNVAKLYAANLLAIPDNQSLGARGDRAIEVLGVANPLQQVAQRGRLIGRLAEGLQVRRASAQLSSSEIEDVKTILQELGASRLGVDAGTFISRLDGDGVTTSEVQRTLRGRARNLRRGSSFSVAPDGLSITPISSPTDLEAADALMAVAERLDKLIGFSERTAYATEDASRRYPMSSRQE
ncbi:MAG: hypothetical protein AAFV43_03535 [Planctomycetota bacterium]